VNAEHTHAPYGDIEQYPHAKLGRCQCGVDMVQYLMPVGSSSNWIEWQPTALGDPCLSCGGFDTPSCCGEDEPARTKYQLHVEEFEDDQRFNPSGIGYRVTVYDNGEELGDGMAYPLSLAVQEALEQSGIIETVRP